jgi:DNA helicase-2/ATP-dependent DNA helicase PcrA
MPLNASLLNQDQLDAVETLNGPLLVLAGAGSGKTRVVTYRIVNLLESGVNSMAILGLTFTNKAAQEMKERVRHLTSSHVLICTFHSLGARLLRESIHFLDYSNNFTIYDDQDVDKLMKVCLGDIPGLAKADTKGFLQLISSAKNGLLAPDQVDVSDLDESLKAFPQVYAKYQAKLKECNALDFDDLLYLPVRLFREHPDVLEHYQNRWSHLLIDEYQDTNEAQYTLVKYLVAVHGNLCVVGDPDQSIYSWRGANVRNILEFESDYPGAKVVRLEQNYRSRMNILEASNALIGYNTGRYEKNLWSDKGPGEKIKHYTADTERGETDFVAERIRLHYDEHNIPLKEMAIFYRTNAQSRVLEDKFLSRRIPYVIVGGVSFYQRREIKDILAFLRMVQSGVDYVSFARTLNLPKRGVGDTTLEKIRLGAIEERLSILAYCEELVKDAPLRHPVRLSAKQKEGLKAYVDIIRELREINKGSPLKDLVQAAIERTGYVEHLKGEMESFQERKENLNALISKAMEWELSTEAPSLEGFLEELSLKSTLDETDASKDCVHLMTIHNGKGLEFEVVFLVGMEEDLFPHANARGDSQALEEERRLCYVGMTRAKEFLYLCDVRQRFLWGTTRLQRPSRFLREVPAEYVEKVRSLFFSKTTAPAPREKILSMKEEDAAEPVVFIDEIDQTVPDEGELLVPGDSVFHNQFGIGSVRQAYHGSVGLTYKVFFSKDNRERTLVAKFANLKKL